MTITGRNRILAAFAAFEASLAGLGLLSVAGILLPPAPGTLPATIDHRAPWIPEILPLLPDAVESLIASSLLGLAALAGGLWLAISFRRATSREFLCYGAFLCGLSLDALRPLIAWTAVSDAPMEFLAFLSRSVWFGRAFGLLSLFLASIYSAGFEYEDPVQALGIAGFASLVMSSVIPVDTGRLSPALLYSPGFVGTISFLWLGMGLVSALNLAIAAFRRSATDYLWMAAGLGLTALGRDGLYFPADLLLNGLSLSLLCGGMILLVRRTYRRSLLE